MNKNSIMLGLLLSIAPQAFGAAGKLEAIAFHGAASLDFGHKEAVKNFLGKARQVITKDGSKEISGRGAREANEKEILSSYKRSIKLEDSDQSDLVLQQRVNQYQQTFLAPLIAELNEEDAMQTEQEAGIQRVQSNSLAAALCVAATSASPAPGASSSPDASPAPGVGGVVDQQPEDVLSAPESEKSSDAELIKELNAVEFSCVSPGPDDILRNAARLIAAASSREGKLRIVVVAIQLANEALEKKDLVDMVRSGYNVLLCAMAEQQRALTDPQTFGVERQRAQENFLKDHGFDQNQPLPEVQEKVTALAAASEQPVENESDNHMNPALRVAMAPLKITGYLPYLFFSHLAGSSSEQIQKTSNSVWGFKL